MHIPFISVTCVIVIFLSLHGRASAGKVADENDPDIECSFTRFSPLKNPPKAATKRTAGASKESRLEKAAKAKQDKAAKAAEQAINKATKAKEKAREKASKDAESANKRANNVADCIKVQPTYNL